MGKILVVEDNSDIRENLTELLELSKFKVFPASNGKEALDIIQSVTPDLILCDVNMPLMNGYELLRSIKADEHLSTIPFIFLTASAQKVDIEKGLAAGATDYLTKPILTEELEKQINKYLSRQIKTS